jgi:hypothetical protein
MEQVENFEEYSETTPESKVVPFNYSATTQRPMMVAEDSAPHENKE